MKVICYGDSNTWGYDPRSYFGSRYEDNWPALLAEKTRWDIQNWGENGREIPRHGVSFPEDAALVIILLGTNDLLQGASAQIAAERMEAFLRGINLDKEKLFLLAPPTMALGEWVGDRTLLESSYAIGKCYRAAAQRLGIAFADAAQWELPLCYDGVHLTEKGHRILAEKILEKLMKL